MLKAQISHRPPAFSLWPWGFSFCLWLAALGILLGSPAWAQTFSESGIPNSDPNAGAVRFNIREYRVTGAPLPTNLLAGVLAPYTGADRSVEDIVKAASDLQRACGAQGYPAMSISVAGGPVTNGIVTLNLFHAASPQILVSGRRYASAEGGSPGLPAMNPAPPQVNPVVAGAAVNAGSAATQGTAAASVTATNAVAAATNATPRFRVDNYLVQGNSVLTPGEVGGVFTNVPGAFGTNVTIGAILKAAGNLQTAYRDRGYLTVVVGLPPQKLTNAEVKVKVTEAPLAAINVQNEGARYFSSNNVMRALPDLHTNLLLNAKIFQRELDMANQNRDRQIYPVVGPGPAPGTSELKLRVKDRLPWHARLELNNDQSTTGTPQLRVNLSTEYDNLWDLEHQVGLQYSFSPEQFKAGNDYVKVPFDEPLVSSYSAYYRLPLGSYPSVQNQVNARPGTFGYNEATHQFSLPPATGRPELTFYASRAVSDTGVQRGPQGYLIQTTTNAPGIGEFHPLSISTNSAGENITLNEDLGGKLVWPLPQIGKMALTLSLGADYKRFQQTSYNTNESLFTIQYPDSGSLQTISTYAPQPGPTTYATLNYFPLNAGLSGSLADKFGATFFNSQVNFNMLPGFSDDGDFAKVSYATTNARANYVTLQLGADRVQTLYKDWSVKLHADGQWANGALIGNEQYAMGGTTGVRGYQDGEAYGDTGWRVMFEPQTPAFNLGTIGSQSGAMPVWLRGSVFMDYGETYLLEPSPGSSHQSFWGVGWAATINLGSHLDGRVSVALPLTSTPQTEAGDPHVYFGIGGQF